jgi:hypothetical protein
MAGCSAKLPDVAATRVWELDPPPGQPTFVLWGTPPRAWHRPDATEEEFRRDARTCLDESAGARARTSREVGAAAAYYTFLDCMVIHDWEPYAVTATSIFVLRAEDQATPSGEPR